MMITACRILMILFVSVFQIDFESFLVQCSIVLLENDESYHEHLCKTLVEQVCQSIPRPLMIRFIRTFLLESNVTDIRWKTHGLIHHMYR